MIKASLVRNIVSMNAKGDVLYILVFVIHIIPTLDIIQKCWHRQRTWQEPPNLDRINKLNHLKLQYYDLTKDLPYYLYLNLEVVLVVLLMRLLVMLLGYSLDEMWGNTMEYLLCIYLYFSAERKEITQQNNQEHINDANNDRTWS